MQLSFGALIVASRMVSAAVFTWWCFSGSILPSTSSLSCCCEEGLVLVSLTYLFSYLYQYALMAIDFIPLLDLAYINELHCSITLTSFGCSESPLWPLGDPSRWLLIDWACVLLIISLLPVTTWWPRAQPVLPTWPFPYLTMRNSALVSQCIYVFNPSIHIKWFQDF